MARDRHASARASSTPTGPGAVAAYVGNPSAFNALGSQHVAQMLRTLGVGRTFNSGTQDCANKFVASEAVFGTSLVHPIPDLDHTDLCIVIGENPRASQASFYSIPNVLGEMRRAAARGTRFVFVNPRRIETPDQGIGDTLLIRPDTDVWFLAALLNEIDRLGGFDTHVIERHGANVEGLRAFIEPYTARCGGRRSPASPQPTSPSWLQPGWSRRAASVHASTGINMGRQGTLAYWLVHMLSFVTGRLDVEGGNLKSDGFFPNAASGAADDRADVSRHRVRPAASRGAAGRAHGRRHPRQRRPDPSDDRRRGQSAVVDRRPGPAAPRRSNSSICSW